MSTSNSNRPRPISFLPPSPPNRGHLSASTPSPSGLAPVYKSYLRRVSTDTDTDTCRKAAPGLALPTITRNMNQNTLGSRANRNTSKYFKVSIKTGVILAVSTASTTFVMLGAVRSVGGDVGRSRAVPTRALVRCLCGEGSFWTFGQKNREFQHSLKLGTGLDGFAFRSSVTLRVTFLCA